MSEYRVSNISTLRAMARNYAGGHSWDHLDGEAVTAAADEIERLKACLRCDDENVRSAWEREGNWKARVDLLEAALRKIRARTYSSDEGCALKADAVAEIYKIAIAGLSGCINHPDRPVRTNLDGDDLCQDCADAWVRGEGEHQAHQTALEQGS